MTIILIVHIHIHALTVAQIMATIAWHIIERIFERWVMVGKSRYDARKDERMAHAMQVSITRPQPISLTDSELDLEHNHVTEARQPIPVRAFVRFHEAVIRPEAEAVAWTPRAVKIRFTMQNGAHHEVWVWASAVDRI